jgi:transposase InsO family protein
VGNTANLVCVDAFSKFDLDDTCLTTQTSVTIKALKERIFSSFSVPKILVSDNAQCFSSREFRQFCFELGIKHVTTSPYHPQLSHAEPFNRNLRAALIAYHSGAHTTWHQNLTLLQITFNSAEHESTKAATLVVMLPF